MTLFPETLPPDKQPYPVPENWVWVRLDALIEETSSGFACSKTHEISKETPDSYPHLRPNNIGYHGILNLEKIVFIPKSKVEPQKDVLKAGTVLFNNTNSQELVGRSVIIKEDMNYAFSNHITRIAIKRQNVVSEWLNYALNKLWMEGFFAQNCKKWVGQAGYNQDMLKYKTFIPLAPLPEQRRIAAKLDSLLGKLREARTLIDEARESFALRRAAILHQAFSGKLTAAWRAEHPEVESAELFAQELFKEKRTYPKGKYRENIFYHIPETWKSVELGAIVKVHSGDNLTKSNMVMDGGIPVYGGNGITGYHNTYNVAQRTIVVGRVGYYCGSVHLTQEKAWITDNAFIVEFSEQQMDFTYLFWLLKYSNLGQTSNSSAQPVISGKTIYPVMIPLPPLLEQREIARRIENLFGHETDAAGLLEMDNELDLLEQSILSRAFRGELGTNDPAEPPAL